MHLVVLQSKAFTHWNLHKGNPVLHPLSPLANWAFVNPLVYSKVSEMLGERNHLSKRHMTGLADDRVVVSTPQLMFLYVDSDPSDNSGPTENTTKSIADRFDKISWFLVNLRYISKQFEFPTVTNDFFVISQVEVSQIPAIQFPVVLPAANVHIRKDIVDTAITWRDIETATTYPLDFIPPTFDTILLDAIHALADGDYRRAVLYAAMSTEIMAATTLDEAYASIVKQGQTTANIRIISIPQANGQTILKDPVYEYLNSKTDFALLLHERPLYLFARSLLVENAQLYQAALKLYRTRNKIVHRGEPPTGNDITYFEMNYSDARAAIECAVNIFKWFGDTGKYFFLESDFYETRSIVE